MSIALYNELVTVVLARDPSFGKKLAMPGPKIEPERNALKMFAFLNRREMVTVFTQNAYDKCRGFISLVGGAAGLKTLAEESGDAAGFFADPRLRAKLEAVFISSEDVTAFREFQALKEACFPPEERTVFVPRVTLPSPDSAAARAGVSRRKLSIALCVSGQYRGHTEQSLRWRNFFFENCDVDIYVHTWNKTGRRLPTHSGNAIRVFERSFADQFEAMLKIASYEDIERYYPSLAKRIRDGGDVFVPQVSGAYNTPRSQVVVEDIAKSPVAEVPNQLKMLYGMARVFEMALSSRKRYDLVFRMRTDSSIQLQPARMNWHAAVDFLSLHPVIVANRGHRVVHLGVDVGDQYAFGVPEAMQHYFRAGESVTPEESEASEFHPDRGFSILGYNLQRHGVQALGVRAGFPEQSGLLWAPWPRLASPPDLIAEKEAMALVSRDIRGRKERAPTDGALLKVSA